MKADTFTKKDFARILVRFLGVYFAYLAVWRIGAIPVGIYFVTKIGSEVRIEDKITLVAFAPQMLSLLIYAAISFYCIRKGNWLIEFISRSGSEESEYEDAVDDECGSMKKFD